MKSPKVPELVKILNIAGCIITIDAVGCQKDIAALIRNKEADYVLALKGNQGRLYAQVEQFFKQAQITGFQEIEHSHPQRK